MTEHVNASSALWNWLMVPKRSKWKQSFETAGCNTANLAVKICVVELSPIVIQAMLF